MAKQNKEFMKKETIYTNNDKMNFIIALLIVLILMSVLIFYFMPARTCHTEEKVIRVDLPHWDGWTNGDYSYSKNDKILCEEGVAKYDNLKKLINWDMQEDKICLIEYQEKICETRGEKNAKV